MKRLILLLVTIYLSVLCYSQTAMDYFGEGCELEREGKNEEALEAYRKGIEADAELWSNYYRLGRLLQEQKRYEEALVPLLKAREIVSDEPYASQSLAASYQGLERYDEAIDVYAKIETILLAVPEDYGVPNMILGSVYYNWGNCLRHQKKYDEAIGIFGKAHEMKPDDADILDCWAWAYEESNRLDEAVEMYKKSIEIAPDNMDAYRGIGDIFAMQCKYEEAISIFQELENKSELGVVNYINWGVCLDAVERYKEALPIYKKVIALEPDNGDAMLNWANALKSMGKHKEALAKSDEHIKLLPSDIRPYINSAFYILESKQRKGATKRLHDYLAIDSDNEMLYEYWDRLLDEMKELDSKLYEKEVVDFQQILEKNSQSSTLQQSEMFMNLCDKYALPKK